MSLAKLEQLKQSLLALDLAKKAVVDALKQTMNSPEIHEIYTDTLVELHHQYTATGDAYDADVIDQLIAVSEVRAFENAHGKGDWRETIKLQKAELPRTNEIRRHCGFTINLRTARIAAAAHTAGLFE